ncbi:PTS sugar transporter subunit IIB [Lapidilactobacillus salsurivasis]
MENLSICLACNLGASTSILVKKMNEVAATSKKLAAVQLKIDAIPAGNISMETAKSYQVIMLGPQVGHRHQEIEQKVAGLDIPVVVIDAADYGSMNAANILKEAIYQIKTHN